MHNMKLRIKFYSLELVHYISNTALQCLAYIVLHRHCITYHAKLIKPRLLSVPKNESCSILWNKVLVWTIQSWHTAVCGV